MRVGQIKGLERVLAKLTYHEGVTLIHHLEELEMAAGDPGPDLRSFLWGLLFGLAVPLFILLANVL